MDVVHQLVQVGREGRVDLSHAGESQAESHVSGGDEVVQVGEVGQLAAFAVAVEKCCTGSLGGEGRLDRIDVALQGAERGVLLGVVV